MNLRYLAGCAALALAATVGAQVPPGWFEECRDLTGDPPPPQYSADYNAYYISNGVFAAQLGVTGTSTWGNSEGLCAPYFSPQRILDASGRLGFSYGAVGSIQSPFDDGLALTMGAPSDPVGDFCFARFTLDTNDPGTSVLFGDDGLTLAFVGASKRYFKCAWTDGENVEVLLTVRTLGDASVLWWEVTNLTEAARPIGMHFGVWGAQHTGSFQPDTQTGSNIAFAVQAFNFGTPKFTAEGYSGWLTAPTVHPVRTEYLLRRTSAKFPEYVEFLHGQTHNVGMRLTNLPGASMQKLYVDPISGTFKGANSVDMMNLGGDYNIHLRDNNISFPVFEDPNPNGVLEKSDVLNVNKSVVQQFPVQMVGAGAQRAIVHVIKSNWGVSDYNDPYTAVVDAPQLVNHDPSGQDGLSPNPMTIRAYVDNQFAKLDQPVTLQNTRFFITLPPGLSLVAGEPSEKVVPTILPNALGFVEWQVESDGNTFGELPVTITFDPTPGPVKNLTTVITVAATPRMRIAADAQMVTFPYDFTDNSLGAVLGLAPEIDFTAYKWDPGQAAYIPASTANRGEGIWIVPTVDEGYVDLNGASRPADTPTGGLLYTMHRGWNMIGNPYNYPVPLSDLVAVVDDAPQDSFTWSELVALGFVSSALAHWDRGTSGDGPGSYKFTTSQTSKMEPQKAYWIFVNTFLPIRLAWQPVLISGLSDSGRADPSPWTQTEKQWRLQLSARTSNGADIENYIGYVSDSSKLESSKIPEPPQGINAPVDMMIEGELNGQLTRLAQAVTNKKTRTEFRVHVNNAAEGDVTVTWPNLPSLPRNVRAKITDVATGEVRDLRSVSGYTYFMSQQGTREFVVSIEQSGSSRPVIGNVVVSQTRGISNAPMTISYALSADALVSVRVLSGSGKEVFTVSRGRADNAGENQVTWNLRDNANRAVAPGAYRVEILAESPNGERVRKIVPVNVIR